MRHTYPYDFVDGLIIVKDGQLRLLIDTGAPSSFGEASSLAFAGRTHPVARDYMGVTPSSISGNVGTPVHALIGVDVLNRYDLTINPSESVLTLNEDEEELTGERMALDEFMGIPIVTASVRGQTIRMFLDTGATLTYLDPEMTAQFPKDGSVEDFNPGLGKFRTDTFMVPISLGTVEIVLRVGVPPPLLQTTLMMAETSGILGTGVLEKYSICVAPRRKVMVLKKRRQEGESSI